MFLATMRKLEKEYHARCYFFLRTNDIAVSFNLNGDLSAAFYCDEKYSGYDGRMHGGIIAALFDWAMTHCLFGHGIKAYTARLHIKYSHPVKTGKNAEINAALKNRSHNNLHELRASLNQDGKTLMRATAVFWEEKP